MKTLRKRYFVKDKETFQYILGNNIAPKEGFESIWICGDIYSLFDTGKVNIGSILDLWGRYVMPCDRVLNVKSDYFEYEIIFINMGNIDTMIKHTGKMIVWTH